MVKDIFGNEHATYKIISDNYERIVIIEDLKLKHNFVVHRQDFNIKTVNHNNTHTNSHASRDRFNLKETQKLHYTYDDLLEKAAIDIYRRST